ncbi:hypothetical protein [Jiella pacifica]|uniref:Uncharacterized protein n=1 Tax=Jiella pacifica TaxID=2696469 RepID=A0A6N9T0K0_9HYPH|nr:hypothetical protein [Jiella pacifica]NDW04641.1 hypothetical protein [Jiella pacifica]
MTGDTDDTIPHRKSEAQAAWQKAYRAEQAARRKPSRDDVARVALHWAITRALTKEPQYLTKLRATIIERLVAQGFDRQGAAARFDELTDRYEDGWTFQRKPHLARAAGAKAVAEDQDGKSER